MSVIAIFLGPSGFCLSYYVVENDSNGRNISSPDTGEEHPTLEVPPSLMEKILRMDSSSRLWPSEVINEYPYPTQTGEFIIHLRVRTDPSGRNELAGMSIEP